MTVKRQPALRHLELRGNGILTCKNCSGAEWCQHLEAAILGGYDEPTVWHSGRGDEFQIRVPMIPTQGQYADCIVRRIDATRPYRLILTHVNAEKGTECDLGITGPGESLKIWRQMIQDYFVSVVPESQKCQNKAHSFSAQNKLASDLRAKPTEPAPRAQIWCMWYNKMCVTCHQQATFMLNNEDLVPDDQGDRRSWSGTYGRRN